MANNGRRFGRTDVAFLIWIGVLVVALLVVGIVLYNKSAEDLPNPTATPVPSALPTETPNPTEDPNEGAGSDYVYKFPRPANVSLNPNLELELTIGGNGSDTLTEVVTLRDSYLFGTTNSATGDFQSKTSVDLFIAVVDEDGQLKKANTFGTNFDDYVILAKPMVKTSVDDENAFMVVSKNTEEKNTIYIYKILEDSLSVSSCKLTLGDDITVNSGIAIMDKLYLGVSSEEYGEKSGSLVVINKNLEIKSSKLVEDVEILDILVTQDRAIMLGNTITDEGNSTACILELSLDNMSEINKVSFMDKERIAMNMVPAPDGGFLITYHYTLSGDKKVGVVKLTKNYAVEFDHIMAGSGYDEVFVEYDLGVEGVKGYHMFATKSADGKLLTDYENICVHGDLNDTVSNIFSNMKLTKIVKNGSNYIAIGEVYVNGSIDIKVATLNRMMYVTNEAVFGGNGADIPVYAIVNSKGELFVFGTTTSTGGDVFHNFGKSDVWFINPYLE